MATAAAPSSSRVPRRPRILIRVLLISSAAVLAIALAAAGWFYWTAKSSLPQLDGALRVNGLGSTVSVLRDGHGLPHISAASVEDLLFAQGFVTAQDRLWQMDMARRFARGELAEVLGPEFFGIDKRQRTLQLNIAVQNSIKLLSERDARYLKAYAAGVNAAIEQQRQHLPIEFRLLRYSPRPWTVEDSFYIATNMIQDLNGVWQREWRREKVLAKLSPVDRADLFPNSSWRDRPPMTDFPIDADQQKTRKSDSQPPQSDDSSVALSSASDFQSECDSCWPGSNNWVVSGIHTASGKPLLSNDMHLQHSIPDVWYEVHLQGGEYNVAGVSLPGIPFVIVGHNARIAWGFTNLGPDVMDLFTEEFNQAGEYLTPAGWERAEHHREVIKVKGRPDQQLELLSTRHGPVITPILPGESRQLALRWTLYDGVRFRFYEIGTAQNWEQFRNAFSEFDAPSQNVVYADVDGHIGYQATGKIPIRKSGDGMVPEPGADGSHDWVGYVPFDQLPSVFDPPSGVLATANGRIAPERYPFMLSNEWGSPYRTERIYKVLRNSTELTPAEMLSLQMDVYSQFDKLCADSFVYAVDHAEKASPRAKQAADLMRGWDGKVTTDAVAPTLVTRSRAELMRLLLEPKLGNLWQQYQWFNSSVALEKLLISKPQRWVPQGYKDFDGVLAAAVEAAVSSPDAPRGLSSWRWGKVSKIDLKHPLFGAVPGLAQWTGTGSMGLSGNGSYTVKAAGKNFGASERMTVDLSNLDSSTLNIVVGQSGQILSPYYMDQFRAWYQGTSFALAFSPDQVRANAHHQLILKPE